MALKKFDSTCHSQIIAYSHETLEGSIRDVQKEVIESEIFDELIKEASTLPTASTRVSERLIVVDAAHDTELSFELASSVPLQVYPSTDMMYYRLTMNR